MLQSPDGQTFGFFPLSDLPPGVWRNGTAYQAKNRWYDANLVRFVEGTIRPWLGWNAHSASTVTGKARALLPWQDPANLLWIAVASESHVYVYSRSGGRTEITPDGLSVGRADAILSAGYGGGTYGSSTWGDSHGGSTNLLDASVWTLDTLEGLLVGVMSDDGRLWSWDGDTGHDLVHPSGSPTGAAACFVTGEGFVLVLGAGGDPRAVQSPDQDSLTDWTPSDINQARSYSIATTGRLMCGVRAAGANLIFTSTDVHAADYQGLPGVYGFRQAGSGCGIISRGGFAKAEGFVAWMSLTGWWLYDGQVRPIPCSVQDDVFRTLNVLQRSKIWALHNAAYGEISWFYPSSAGTEIDRYVTWNYREDHWTNGALARTCGYEAGVFPWPLMVDATGAVLQHENGLAYGGLDAAVRAYIETGPLELGDGDRVFDVLQIEPDASNLGDVSAVFSSRLHATGADAVSAAFPLANPTSVRVSGRQQRQRLQGAPLNDPTHYTPANWRVGPGTRLDIRAGGLR